MRRNVIILIPTRMGSKRFPGKALHDICGFPLIHWAYTFADLSGYTSIVITPDTEIHKYLYLEHGIPCLLTSNRPNNGTERCWEVVNSSLDSFGKDDIVINVQGDLARFDYKIISEMVRLLETPDIDYVTSFSFFPYGNLENPNRVKCSIKKDIDKGQMIVSDFSRDPILGTKNYLHIGIYGFKKKSLRWYASLPPTSGERKKNLEQMRILESGFRIAAVMSICPPITIDCKEDISCAEKEMIKQIQNFPDW